MVNRSNHPGIGVPYEGQHHYDDVIGDSSDFLSKKGRPPANLEVKVRDSKKDAVKRKYGEDTPTKTLGTLQIWDLTGTNEQGDIKDTETYRILLSHHGDTFKVRAGEFRSNEHKKMLDTIKASGRSLGVPVNLKSAQENIALEQIYGKPKGRNKDILGIKYTGEFRDRLLFGDFDKTIFNGKHKLQGCRHEYPNNFYREWLEPKLTQTRYTSDRRLTFKCTPEMVKPNFPDYMWSNGEEPYEYGKKIKLRHNSHLIIGFYGDQYFYYTVAVPQFKEAKALYTATEEEKPEPSETGAIIFTPNRTEGIEHPYWTNEKGNGNNSGNYPINVKYTGQHPFVYTNGGKRDISIRNEIYHPAQYSQTVDKYGDVVYEKVSEGWTEVTYSSTTKYFDVEYRLEKMEVSGDISAIVQGNEGNIARREEGNLKI